jgi:hypothetical protein
MVTVAQGGELLNRLPGCREKKLVLGTHRSALTWLPKGRVTKTARKNLRQFEN